MKRFYLLKMTVLVSVLLGLMPAAKAQTYNYTGAVQTYTVPAGVAQLSVDMQGAEGGNSSYGYGPAGYGGRVQCVLAVTPGQVLNIYVGGAAPTSSSVCCVVTSPGGWNGGGNGQYYYSAGGGGASDIRVGGNALSNRVVVAGGGGGGGYGCCCTANLGQGGPGGGLTGGNGFMCGSQSYSGLCYNGTGGTQTAGGTAPTCGSGQTSGTAGQGGLGSTSYWGAGGGGGYYGGSGAYGGGGGGGSSFTDPVLCSGAVHTQGYNTGAGPNGANGIVRICPIPFAGSIVGNTNVCPGTATTLSNPTGATPGTWSSTSSNITVNATTGLVTGFTTGTAVVSYSTSNACATGVATTTVTINPIPPAITGPLNVCVGSNITLTDAASGGTWTSGNISMATIGSASGIVNAISGGSPVISYTLPTGCVRTTTLSSNPLPNAFNVTAPSGNAYCASGTGVAIGLNGSNTGISYQLYNGSALVGSAMAGTGAPLSFGVQPAGSYSVAATNVASGCVANMTGIQAVTMNPLPTVNNVTTPGGTNFCVGSTGVPVGLNGSTVGVNYQLYAGSTAMGAPVPGSGSGFSFGNMTVAGTYSVLATDATTFCQSAMSGTPVLNAHPAPMIFAVTGGGTYCAGGSGKTVGLSGSEVGVNYTLQLGASNVGSASGTGGPIGFGTYSGAGNYTVVAANAATGCTSNMSGMATISVAPLPVIHNVTGGGSYCAGGTGVHIGLDFSNSTISYQLMRGSALVGVATLGTDNSLDFGLQATTGFYSVVATNPATGCTSTMSGVATVSTSSLPSVYTVTVSPSSSYCAGGSGVDVKLTNSTSGVNYQLMYGSSLVSTMAGTGLPLDFGSQTNAGSYTVVAANATTGCVSNMAGSANVIVNPLPSQYLVTGGGDYCAGGTGVPIGLNNSDPGIRYQLMKGASVVVTMSGSGGSLGFGNLTTSGSYSVLATDLATGCQQMMAGSTSVTIDPLPTAYTVTGGGSYCSGGAGQHVILSFSNSGINYQLKLGGTAVGLPMSGSDNTLDFGAQTAAGNYSIVATNATTSCTSSMTGTVTVTVNALPAPFAVTGGGNYCAGTSGVLVGLGGTTSGIKYQLYNGSALVGSAVTGTGSSISFGNQLTPGTYSVMATNTATGCTNSMTGTVAVSMSTAPAAYTVTGGGSYCAGGAGEPVGLSNSDAGVNYMLYDGSTLISTMGGSGSSFNFGTYTAPGNYTVKSTDLTSGCSADMSGNAIVTVLPLPIVYTVMGGGAYCAGGPGLHITLSGSSTGVNYQLMSSTAGAVLAGTNAALDFGAITAGDTYSVVATDAATGCTSNMASTATITVNSAPTVDTVTGGGSYCSGGSGVAVGLNTSDAGIQYQLIYSGTAVGLPVAGSGSSIGFGSRTADGTYTVRATNPSTGCVSDMSGSATVTVIPSVTPSISFTTSSMNVCTGTAVSFNATGMNGGAIPFYQWYVNGHPMGTDTTYFSYMPSSGDVVTVDMTSSAACASPATASGMPATLTVNAVVTPSVTVSMNTSNTICKGTPVLFSATPYYGGSGATYTWYKNGTQAGTGINYSDATLNNNDVVKVAMVSNYMCVTPGMETVNSSNETMTVVIPATPNVTITASPGNAVLIAHADTLRATVTNAGSSPAYQWSVNNNPIPGATGLTFVSSNFNDGDVVGFMVTNNSACGVETGNSTLALSVINNLGVNNVSAEANFTVLPNPNKGMFTIKGTLASGSDEDVAVEVTNMLGQVVYKDNVAAQHGNVEHRVQLGNVANGMYILSLKSGNASAVFHIVVEQ